MPLKDDGKLFIQVLTPYSNPFARFRLTFEEAKRKQQSWPGFLPDIYEEFQNIWGYKLENSGFLPKSCHPLDIETVKLALENAGFEIDLINYLDIGAKSDEPLSDYYEVDALFEGNSSINNQIQELIEELSWRSESSVDRINVEDARDFYMSKRNLLICPERSGIAVVAKIKKT